MTSTNKPTQIIIGWLESQDCTRSFWSQRAERWAADMPPEDARRLLADEIEQAMRLARPDDAALSVWGQLTSHVLDEVCWAEVASHWLATTRQGAIWTRLCPDSEPISTAS